MLAVDVTGEQLANAWKLAIFRLMLVIQETVGDESEDAMWRRGEALGLAIEATRAADHLGIELPLGCLAHHGTTLLMKVRRVMAAEGRGIDATLDALRGFELWARRWCVGPDDRREGKK